MSFEILEPSSPLGAHLSTLYPRNHALDTNPPIADNNITSRGSSWMWAVAALHGFLFLVILPYAIIKKNRLGYLSLGILLFPTIAYFTMASNLGATAVPVEFRSDGLNGRTREVFWVRFVEWTLTWTLISLSLMLLTTIGLATLLTTLGLTILYAVMLLCGALTATSYKWGFFLFALFAYFLLLIYLLVEAPRGTPPRGLERDRDRDKPRKSYYPFTLYILFFWALYPICWGLSEGGNVISNNAECVFYGILDIFSKGLFAVMLLFVARKDHERGVTSRGGHRGGEVAAAAAVAGAGAGAVAGSESAGGVGTGTTNYPATTTTTTPGTEIGTTAQSPGQAGTRYGSDPSYATGGGVPSTTTTGPTPV